MNSFVRAMRWKKDSVPKKILAIRFQALGDTIITLPYLNDLKKQYPEIELHFLTRREVGQIPKQLHFFDKVIEIGGGRNAKVQFLFLLLRLPSLLLQKYDVVLDLQNHRFSRILRRVLMAKSWAEFDRDSPRSAADRTISTIESVWNWRINFNPLALPLSKSSQTLLQENGWKQGNRLIVLNPAGYCLSRNWPVASYIAFGVQWLEKVDSQTQFVLLLMDMHKEKALVIKNSLKDRCIDLTGKTNQIHAFEIIGRSSLVLSEDSGLMHMTWTQDIPTIALFSSSRKDWSGPQGKKSLCLDSSDLSCGPCHLEVCKFGDNRCLTRYSSEMVISHAKKLLEIE